jgi:hypothetical protein
MNYCNLAKVILAREAKEKALIDLILLLPVVMAA